MKPKKIEKEFYVRDLKPEEMANIRKTIRRHIDARVVRSAQIVSLSSQKKSPEEISGLLECSTQTVQQVIANFNKEGIPNLDKKPVEFVTLPKEIGAKCADESDILDCLVCDD